jgi:eukaryotic-like serine/threonine-protein kinase
MPSPLPADEPRQAPSQGALPEPSEGAPATSEVSAPSDEPAIKQLGEFRIIRLLGRGGMAEVYLAEQTSLHRSVAIKVLRPELLTDKTIVKRFEQEAQAVAGLIHPNIVQVFAFGQQDGIHFIAQEYVQGLNLRQFLNRKGPPELLVAYHVMRQVAAALAVAGDAGIVHRDIKPENILITRKGEAKVTDFGLAQLAVSEQRVQLTQVGVTMGTPLYMSPEQINGDAVDHRSDIYSFGVTCYRMLSGRPPFRGDTSLTLAMQHLTKTPEPLGTLRADLPPLMGEIVHKMMARFPADRYQHAREITQDLKRVARILKEEQPDAATPAKPPRVISAKLARNWREAFFQWSGARHAAILAVAAVVVACGSAAVGWWLRPADPLAAQATRQDPVPKLRTAKDQFERAHNGLQTDEDAWRAVLQYFPEDRIYTPEAKERLAVLYLKARRLDEAKTLFDDLESMGRENPNAQAAGIAGQAVIASLQKNYQKSQRLIVFSLHDLPRVREQVTSDLWYLLQHAGRENAQHLGEEANKQLKELFEEEP